MQPTLNTLGIIRTTPIIKTPTAFDHIKSRYWNKSATKSIHAKIRKHYMRERFMVQAM